VPPPTAVLPTIGDAAGVQLGDDAGLKGLRRSWAIQLQLGDDAGLKGLRRSWAIQL
jgi:hypothetical protein